jgi:hypothetical protein
MVKKHFTETKCEPHEAHRSEIPYLPLETGDGGWKMNNS